MGPLCGREALSHLRHSCAQRQVRDLHAACSICSTCSLVHALKALNQSLLSFVYSKCCSCIVGSGPAPSANPFSIERSSICPVLCWPLRTLWQTPLACLEVRPFIALLPLSLASLCQAYPSSRQSLSRALNTHSHADLRTTSHTCRSGEAFWSEALVPGSNMQLAGGPCVKGRCSGVPIVHLRPNTAVCFQRSPNGNKHSPFTCSGRRQCRCRGILDSYRAEQAAKDTKAKQLEQHRQAGIGGVQMLVYDSVDEDACPAECVMEVFTAPQFKKVCQV